MKNKTHPIILLLLVIAACGDEPPIDAPSPLLTADSDRLWILLRASRVGNGVKCSEFFQHPEDPRYKGLRSSCDVWTRNVADYLRVNGFPTVEYQHLQQRAYWQWFDHTRNTIQDCRNRLGVLPVPSSIEWREEHYRSRNECDPYDHLRNNQHRTPADLGIRYP